MKMKEAISEMSLQKKIAFCTGADFWHTKALPQYDIPAIMMSDGPHGLRCQKGEADMIGVNKSLPATCFPTAVTAGATWNRELYAAEGEAIGQEALAAGVPVVLGPGCNIKRNPLGGRNFEYISEDPYFAGEMAAAFIRGQQSTGAASSLKHFAANSQEYKRQNGDSQMDERTLREIYPFGHGLSYTTFTYSDLKVDGRTVSVCVTNSGAVKGAEVVQLYIAPPKGGLFRPEKELKGFDRVELEPGESKTVTFTLDDRSFALWSDGWKIQSGTYGVWVGSSSRDNRLKTEIPVSGEQLPAPTWQAGSWYETLSGTPSREKWEALMGHPVSILPEPKKGSFTMDNSCLEMKDSSLMMKIQYKVTENIIAKDFGGKKDLSDPAYRMTRTCATDCPLRAVIINSGGSMSDSMAAGLLHMANGHYLKGLKCICIPAKKQK